MAAYPRDLWCRESRHRPIARDRGGLRTIALEFRAFPATAPVVPEDGRRSARALESSSVAPCIWPERPTARTAERSAGCRSLTAPFVAAHQSAGFCSDQSACGRETDSADVV